MWDVLLPFLALDVSVLISFIFSPLLSNSIEQKSPTWNHFNFFFFSLVLIICRCFYHTLDIKRRARTALPSTWSICCFMGQTPLLKMPQGTLLSTFLPCTTRRVWKQILCMKHYYYNKYLQAFQPAGVNLSLPLYELQESCVRVLLYRGANKEAKNKHGQTPFQVNYSSHRLNNMCLFLVVQNWSQNTTSNGGWPELIWAFMITSQCSWKTTEVTSQSESPLTNFYPCKNR